MAYKPLHKIYIDLLISNWCCYPFDNWDAPEMYEMLVDAVTAYVEGNLGSHGLSRFGEPVHGNL